MPDSPAHLECVYATLASWGMHRIGKGGSKMQPIETFRASVVPLKGRILEAQSFAPEMMDAQAWAALKDIFPEHKDHGQRHMLVGNSKVMHHMLPNVVPPIDREYTLRYLRGNTNIANDPQREDDAGHDHGLLHPARVRSGIWRDGSGLDGGQQRLSVGHVGQ